ncbi:uncharacterized protein LOC106165109 [Lingula anatina]|uniref:Uncharacterized protein LOC106165109 n=1 Tax=Lingula anatina TaxID=7574 RepID=A0A1S3IMA2_LINAN|nr:uncharacterized protein LOC106165109 [Lingula anatina]|eukprot:XP_013398659.1 uncharacterized protein LOC106165109 [Lingula anatina]
MDRMVQTLVLLVILNCWLGQVFCSPVALEESTDIDTVYVRENGTVALQWSLFIGENAGRSSVNVMIKKRDALLCQWVKAHGEVNQCDQGMKLTINPEQVRVPGPTNINVTFSFENKKHTDNGIYDCCFVIDEKWREMQKLEKKLETTAEPNVTATYNDSSNTTITCFVSGGRPKPVETILLLNGTEISRSECTYCRNNSKCSSIHSVEKLTGIYKCRVELVGDVVDSAEVDIPFTTKDTHNQTSAVGNVGVNTVQTVCVIAVLLVLAFGLIIIVVWRCRIFWNPVKTPANDVIHQAEETEHCVAHYTKSSGSVEIVASSENENEPCLSQNQAPSHRKSVAKI